MAVEAHVSRHDAPEIVLEVTHHDAIIITVVLSALGTGVCAILLALPLVAAAAPTAPGFSVTLLDGGTFDSRTLLGKTVLVLRFQASWCKVCGREAASFNRVAERYRARGVQALAIHVQDTAADARRFIQKHGITYPVALDPKLRIGNRFGVTGTPYTIVINRRGEVAARLGGVSAPTRLPKVLEPLVANPVAQLAPPPHFTARLATVAPHGAPPSLSSHRRGLTRRGRERRRRAWSGACRPG
jgi:peroxiredoxin